MSRCAGDEAASIAQAQGFADLQWRSQDWQGTHGVRGAAPLARAAVQQLRGSARSLLFDAVLAARREPRTKLKART